MTCFHHVLLCACVLEAIHEDLWPSQVQGFKQRRESSSREGESSLLLQLAPPQLLLLSQLL